MYLWFSRGVVLPFKGVLKIRSCFGCHYELDLQRPSLGGGECCQTPTMHRRACPKDNCSESPMAFEYPLDLETLNVWRDFKIGGVFFLIFLNTLSHVITYRIILLLYFLIEPSLFGRISFIFSTLIIFNLSWYVFLASIQVRSLCFLSCTYKFILLPLLLKLTSL